MHETWTKLKLSSLHWHTHNRFINSVWVAFCFCSYTLSHHHSALYWDIVTKEWTKEFKITNKKTNRNELYREKRNDNNKIGKRTHKYQCVSTKDARGYYNTRLRSVTQTPFIACIAQCLLNIFMTTTTME